MAPEGLTVGPPALVGLEPWRRGLTLLACAVCLAVSLVHIVRDDRGAAGLGLAAVAGVIAAAAWWGRRRPALALLALHRSGWQARFMAPIDGEPVPVRLDGVLASPRGLLLRVRPATPRPDLRFDELVWVDRRSLGDGRWTLLRSTLRLALPPEPPTAPAP